MSFIAQLKKLDEKLNGKNFTLHTSTTPLQKLKALETDFDRQDLAKYHIAKQLEAAFEYSITGMALVRLDGTFLKVNIKACEIWERTEEELLDLRWQDITHPDDIEPDEDQVGRAVDHSIAGYILEKRYIMPSGKAKPCVLNVTIINDPITHAPLYFVSQIQSVNDVIEQAEKFKAGRVRAERRGG
jgi:PAS domain S-box-containing protein